MRVLWTLLMLLLAGCATQPPPATLVDGLFDDTAFAETRVTTDASAVLAVTPAMRAYLHDKVAPKALMWGPQTGLVDALNSTAQLKLDYDADFTRTASEAFDARMGNCLSLVIMTAALAKELGLDVRYQEMAVDDFWVRDGNLIQLVGHVNVSLGRGSGVNQWAGSPMHWVTVDFVPIDDTQRQRARLIDERRIVAMYFNNRAAEALAAGKPGEAYWWARAGILQDPAYLPSYVTIGVAARRAHRFDLAERAYRRALALDARNPQALHNLAELLDRLGRKEEAAATAALLERVRPDSLAASYQNGLSAMNAGEYRRARDAFTRALRWAPEDSEIHYLLAVTYLRLGESGEAIDHLRHARDATRTVERRRAFAYKLSVLDKAFRHAGSTLDATEPRP